MFKSVSLVGAFNERTGYGVHTSRLADALEKMIPVHRNQPGEVTISLLDVVTASHATTFPPSPSILMTVWESTEYPAQFIANLKHYDQLWLVSEWEKSCAIAQGIPEEFIRVVHEGVDPEVYKPAPQDFNDNRPFDFVHVGQFQPRKSTREIVEAFLKAFPKNKNVRLYLSADTLFPSDNYKSTEERLKAHGLEDPRIIVVHHEERESYIRRLQGAHVFVTCARSEGWNLPLIEAMACGIPAIAADFGGSTEYAKDCITVRVPQLKKPEGIYGNWDVPGMWGEPDYDHLVEQMKDAYKNYSLHKEMALKTSEYIRTEFSWKRAAEKAMAVLEELSQKTEQITICATPENHEASIRAYARRYGFEIKEMHRRKAIFTVDTHPDLPEKMETLKETIRQIKSLDYPVLISSHLALPQEVIEMADFYIYDKRDILSGDDRPFYTRPNGAETESVQAGVQCHALAALMNVRNSIDFCKDKYDWMYQMASDTEVDLKEWLEKVHASDKKLICLAWENQPETISGQITAASPEVMDKILPRLSSWKEFVDFYGAERFCSERGYYRQAMKEVGEENVEWLTIGVGNRFNQLDKNAWKDDLFQCHFVEGPYLHIAGFSGKEYDVEYSTPTDGIIYGLKQKPGIWSRPSIKYYKDWTIRASLDGEVKFEHKMDLKGKNILISMGSKALGDTIAWLPYVEEFRKKHDCKVFLSCWWQDIFDYPEINFVEPGSSIEDIYASYDVGCFDDQLDKNVKNWRDTPLQQVCADILGVEYKPIRAKLKHKKAGKGNGGSKKKPHICFSEYSTMRNKLWNREGAWQKVIDYLSPAYECISISNEMTALKNVTSHNGQPIEDTIKDIGSAAFYLGLNAGPSWIAYALNVPCVMITGVSEEWNDFPNPYRVAVDVGCKPCFNDVSVPISRDWEWCNSGKDYACTKEITEAMVVKAIRKVKGVKDAIKEGFVLKGSKRKREGIGAQRKAAKAGRGNRPRKSGEVKEGVRHWQ